MKKILFVVLLCIVPTGAAFGQNKRVAITEIVDAQGNVNNGLKLVVRSSIIAGINNIEGYEAYECVNISAMLKELDFQRTGMVSDEQIHNFGEIIGVSYILMVEVAMLDTGNIIITAKIVNVETVQVENSVTKSSSTEALELKETCNSLVMNVFCEL